MREGSGEGAVTSGKKKGMILPTLVPSMMSEFSLKKLVSSEMLMVAGGFVSEALLPGRMKYVLKLRGGRVS